MSSVVSFTDEVAHLTLDQLARAVGAILPDAAAVRRRPPATHLFCKKLLLEGPWGTVAHGDIVHRSHPAVAGNEEWFVETSIGQGIGPDDEPTGGSSPFGTVRATLRRTPSTRQFTIRLSDTVVRGIMEQAWTANGVEVGGYLWSRRRAGVNDVDVVWVNGAASDSLHWPNMLKLA